MREQQSRQSTDTQQMAESTMRQSQEAMEQLIDLQRNVARMTLSALKWQETAQRQGLEMTRSMLESAPGPQLTESMMQSYLQGMEAIMPEMEQVMERGMEAAAQPQMAGMEQMGGQMTGQSQMTGQGSHQQWQQPNQQWMQPSQQGMGQRGQGPSQHGTSEPMEGQQMGSDHPSQRMAGPMSGQQSGQGMSGPTSGQQTGGQGRRTDEGGTRSQSQQSHQYPQTGEWVTPGEYGGESSSAYGYQQQPMTARPSHSRQTQQSGSQSGRGEPDRSQQSGQRGTSSSQFERGQQDHRSQQSHPRTGQQGGQSRGGYQGQHGGGYEQSTQRSESSQPRTTEQGRFTGQYSQQIDADRREQGEQSRPTGRDRQEQRHGRQSTERGSGGPESERSEGRGRGGRTRGDETSRMEEMDIAAEGSERAPDENRGDQRGDRDRGSERD